MCIHRHTKYPVKNSAYAQTSFTVGGGWESM